MPAFTRIQKGEKKSETSETTSRLASGGFNLNIKTDEYEKEAREHRPMGRDASKAKKKSYASSRATRLLHTIEESGVGYPGGGANQSLFAGNTTTEAAGDEERNQGVL
ncbi:hypothetical protein Tco_0307464 [Tanacetum coccineum]